MAWRTARSLLTLRDQVNIAAPRRSRISDGTIGDADHQKRTSDHNPWVFPPGGGIVTALDITHDPKGGYDAHGHAREIVRVGDPRLKYVISNGKIWSRARAREGWRSYSGPNDHSLHAHYSVEANAVLLDSTAPWSGLAATISRNWLEKGDMGTSVETWQRQLASVGFSVEVDGIFGDETHRQTIAFQTSAGITTDGLVGAQSIKAMEDRIHYKDAPIDIEVAVVAHTDIDEGMALVVGRALGIRVLRTGHTEKVRRAFLVGAAANRTTFEYQEDRIIAGPNRRETALAVDQLLEDYYEAGRPRGLRALTF